MIDPTPDPRKVAEGLSEAQRKYMRLAWEEFPGGRWVAFPPANTHRVLQDIGLLDWFGELLPLGLAVRAILKETRHAD